MRKFQEKTAIGVLLTAAAFVASTPASAGVSVRSLASDEVQLSTIAHRMAVANHRTCKRPEMMTGMVLHDLTQYHRSQRAAASRAFSLSSGIGILQFVPGSTATRAGLQIDDEILAVGDLSVEDPAAVASNHKSFRRMDRFLDVLQARLRLGQVQLLVRRRGELHRVYLSGEPGCGGGLSLSNSAGLNAWADGKHVVVTAGMSQFARSNDEIAFVIAHEMAHNILGHVHKASEARGIFGLLGRRSKSREVDADIYAVRLMSAAGYNPQAGISFLERTRRQLWWAFSLSHPGFGRRIQSVAQAIANLAPAAPPRVAANQRYNQTVARATMPSRQNHRMPIGITG